MTIPVTVLLNQLVSDKVELQQKLDETSKRLDAYMERCVELAGYYNTLLNAESTDEQVRQISLHRDHILEVNDRLRAQLSAKKELLHASVIKRIWKKCKEDELDYVAFAWRVQKEVQQCESA